MKESITSKRGYVIGDIWYCLESHIYDMWFDACDTDKDDGRLISKFIVPKGTTVNAGPINEDLTFLVEETAHGDGIYRDNVGKEYGVDSGCIGLVPLELAELGARYEMAGRVIHSTEPATMEVVDGVFRFIIGSALHEIDTSGPNEYEEYEA